MLVNAYLRLKSLPLGKVRSLQAWLPPTKGTTKATTMASQIISGLLGMPPRTVEENVRHVIRQGFVTSSRKRVFPNSSIPPTEQGARPADSAREQNAPVPPIEQGVPPAGSAREQNATVVSACGLASAPVRQGAAPPAASGKEQGAVVSASAAGESCHCPHEAPPGFTNAVRAAMFVASHGIPKSSFPRVST